MNAKNTRQFDDKPAVRESIPLLLGLMGPSGGGKTYSALELATGIQSVSGGEIYVIDTESRRALHYAERYRFRHVNFEPPFGSLDYLAAINHCVNKGATVIVIDSMSHEHEGPGGMLEAHEVELDRLAGTDFKKREGCKMLAWARPKADRRKLRIGLLQAGCHLIFCFRAKETARPVRDKNGKMQVEALGFMPIAGDEFVFEMTANMLLLPHADGLPSWRSDQIGEQMMMKLPAQFRGLLDDGKPLSRDHGHRLAEWARGGQSKTSDQLVAEGETEADKGTEALRVWWGSIPPSPAKKTASAYMIQWKATAEQVDHLAASQEADDAFTDQADGPQEDQSAEVAA